MRLPGIDSTHQWRAGYRSAFWVKTLCTSSHYSLLKRTFATFQIFNCLLSSPWALRYKQPYPELPPTWSPGVSAMEPLLGTYMTSGLWVFLREATKCTTLSRSHFSARCFGPRRADMEFEKFLTGSQGRVCSKDFILDLHNHHHFYSLKGRNWLPALPVIDGGT